MDGCPFLGLMCLCITSIPSCCVRLTRRHGDWGHYHCLWCTVNCSERLRWVPDIVVAVGICKDGGGGTTGERTDGMKEGVSVLLKEGGVLLIVRGVLLGLRAGDKAV